MISFKLQLCFTKKLIIPHVIEITCIPINNLYNQVIATNLKASEVYSGLRHYLYHETNSQHAIRQAIEEIASQKED